MREITYTDLEESDTWAIHDVLYGLGLINTKDYVEVEKFFTLLPDNIKAEGQHWGFNDTVVRDNMYVWFKETYDR